MYARSTTVKGQPDKIDAGIAHVKDEVLPGVSQVEGCIGLSMLVDRGTGECIVTTAWKTAEAMAASAEQVKPLRDKAVELLGGTAEIQEWEVAVMHRDHQASDGACTRAAWFRVDPTAADRAIDVFKMGALPKIEEMAGFCSASLLVDRASGLAVSSVAFDSRDALDRSREAANALRDEASRQAGAEVLDVREFELALAHLHVPEMA